MNQPLDPPSPPAGQPPASPPPPGGPPAGGRPGLPWELAKDFNALLETAKLLITAPGQAFARAREKGDYASPLLFAVIFYVIGAIFQQFWQLLFGPASWMRYMNQMGDVPPEVREMLRGLGATPGPVALVFGVILAPIIGIIVLFVISAIVHLVLQLIGGLRESTAGFEGTFRVLSYGQIAQIATVVPIAGGLIAFVWGLVLYVLGLSSLHRCSQGQALAAVLIPLAVCCICVILAMVLFAGSIAAMLGAAANN